MGRRARRRPPGPARAPAPGWVPVEVERHPDGDWAVRRVTGAASTKAYRCPGCDQEILPATPHVVAWPAGGAGPGPWGRGADGDPDGPGLGDRRHWHTPCWSARDRRRPTRRR